MCADTGEAEEAALCSTLSLAFVYSGVIKYIKFDKFTQILKAANNLSLPQAGSTFRALLLQKKQGYLKGSLRQKRKQCFTQILPHVMKKRRCEYNRRRVGFVGLCQYHNGLLGQLHIEKPRIVY